MPYIKPSDIFKYIATSMIIFLVMACASESSSGISTGEEPPEYGGVLVRAHPTDPAGFDPVQDTSITTLFLIAPIYSQLIRFDPESKVNELLPELAHRWEMDGEGTRLTFYLRPEVKWQDGQDFTSADVKSHFERLISPPSGIFSNQRAPFLHVKDIFTPDPLTVVFETEFATASLLSSFAGGHYMIVSKHIMERETRVQATGLRKNPAALIGTGPFIYHDYQPGVAFKVRRNSNYWDNAKPYLDGMDFVIIRDATTRFSALALGKVHMSPHGSPSLTAPQAKQAKKEFSQDVRLHRVRGPFWIGAAFNSTRSPFNDTRVRQAMSMAVDRQAYVNVVTGGPAEGTGMMAGFSPPGSSFALPLSDLHSSVPGYYDVSGNKDKRARDLIRAQELLGEAGWPYGFKTSIMVRGDTPVWVDAALFFQDQWKLIGIKAEVEQVDFATSIQRMLKGQFDVRISGTAFNMLDPDQILFAPFSSLGPSFLYYPKDQELDRLLNKQRRTLQPAAREKLAQAAELRLLQQVIPTIVGHYSIYIYGTRPEVRGWEAQDYMLYNQERMDQVWLQR
jgi:peptide/nickel transport system substrate-binding protein